MTRNWKIAITASILLNVALLIMCGALYLVAQRELAVTSLWQATAIIYKEKAELCLHVEPK